MRAGSCARVSARGPRKWDSCPETPTCRGGVGLSQRGGRGGRYGHLDRPPPKKGSIEGSPKILPRLTPGPRRCPGPKMKMGFLESALRGESEKAPVALDLVKIFLTIFNAQKKISAPLTPFNCAPFPNPFPPQLRGALWTPSPSRNPDFPLLVHWGHAFRPQ